MKLVINPPQSVFNQLINLAGATHGWAHQPYDYKFYSDAFDGYWLICMVDTTKDPNNNFIAGGCLARWDAINEEPLYSIGLYYCRKEFRGKGYGKPVFKAMMDIVGGANCVLTAAVDMSQKYADIFGFKEMPEYWHLEAEIQPGKMRIPELSNSYTTETWKNVNPDQLTNYDLTICSRNRQKKMELWFQQNEVFTKVAFDSAHKIVGYCTIRVVNLNRLCAAPFYAENAEIAARLLADVSKMIPNFEKYEKLIFWYPAVNRNVER